MEMGEERAGLISASVGAAFVILIASGRAISRDSLVAELERRRRMTVNVIGKGMNRYAAELVRKGL